MRLAAARRQEATRAQRLLAKSDRVAVALTAPGAAAKARAKPRLRVALLVAAQRPRVARLGTAARAQPEVPPSVESPALAVAARLEVLRQLGVLRQRVVLRPAAELRQLEVHRQLEVLRQRVVLRPAAALRRPVAPPLRAGPWEPEARLAAVVAPGRRRRPRTEALATWSLAGARRRTAWLGQ